MKNWIKKMQIKWKKFKKWFYEEIIFNFKTYK